MDCTTSQWSRDHKWSRTVNDPQIGPQMIQIKNMEWHGYWNGVDLRMTIDLQHWSKRLGTLKEMRRENTPRLLKSYFTCYNAWSCCWKSPFLLSPLPSTGGGGGDGGGGEKMRHFHQLLRYCPKSFDQSCSNIGFYKCMTCIRNTTYIIT